MVKVGLADTPARLERAIIQGICIGTAIAGWIRDNVHTPLRRILRMKPIKYAERGLAALAGATFNSIQAINKYRPNPPSPPKCSDKPLLKSWQKTKPTLGWPRTTDSLCPNCVIEARESI